MEHITVLFWKPSQWQGRVTDYVLRFFGYTKGLTHTSVLLSNNTVLDYTVDGFFSYPFHPYYEDLVVGESIDLSISTEKLLLLYTFANAVSTQDMKYTYSGALIYLCRLLGVHKDNPTPSCISWVERCLLGTDLCTCPEDLLNTLKREYE